MIGILDTLDLDQIAIMESNWAKVAQDTPLEWKFLDDRLDQLYHAEERLSKMIRAFSILAILLACLGLYGVLAFMINNRIKEFGIRKVLGATVPSLVTLLSKDFLKLVFVALVIASPLAYYFMNGWLDNFANRIDIHWLTFLLAGILAIGIAFLTIGFQSVKAALANPVNSLRSE